MSNNSVDGKKYHINPNTGMPSICRAREGNCPYGGEAGNDNHYNTFSEAQLAAQGLLESSHKLLPVTKFFDNNKIAKEYSELTWQEEDTSKTDIEIEYEIMTTEDTELIMDVIDGKRHVEEGWGKISVALQNPNIPREFVDKVLDNPDEYHIETQRWLMLNKSLRHEDLIKVAESDVDLYARTIALKHPSLKREYAEEFLATRSQELHELPWVSMVDNPAVAGDSEYRVFFEYRIDCGMNRIQLTSLEAMTISERYRDWMVNYANRK